MKHWKKVTLSDGFSKTVAVYFWRCKRWCAFVCVYRNVCVCVCVCVCLWLCVCMCVFSPVWCLWVLQRVWDNGCENERERDSWEMGEREIKKCKDFLPSVRSRIIASRTSAIPPSWPTPKGLNGHHCIHYIKCLGMLNDNTSDGIMLLLTLYPCRVTLSA